MPRLMAMARRSRRDEVMRRHRVSGAEAAIVPGPLLSPRYQGCEVGLTGPLGSLKPQRRRRYDRPAANALAPYREAMQLAKGD